VIGWMACAAMAEEPAPEPAPAPPAPAEPASIPLDAGDEVLPSALDGLEQARAETPQGLSLDDVVQDWVPTTRQRLRGQVFAKPVAGVVVLPGDGASARLGGALGHRLWTMKPGLLSFGTEERLVATGVLGAGSGGAVAASAVLGPWLGPVGLRAGPTVRHDALRWSDDVALSGATAVGVAGDLTVVAGPVSLTAGVEPAWLVSGERRAAPDALLVGLGDETTWRAGVGWLGRPLQWGLDLEARDTAVGTIWSGGLSLQLRFL
jgi:hypothetical protein